MTEPGKSKLLHFRCPPALLQMLETEGASNLSALIVRRLGWSYDADGANGPKHYKAGLVDGINMANRLHLAMLRLAQDQSIEMASAVANGKDLDEAMAEAAHLECDVPLPPGSPKGGHKLRQRGQ